MTERKRWDKQHDFHPSTSSTTPDSKADPVLTKQLQYLKVLEERNRVKKRLAAAKRNDRLHEREEAFVTAFNVPARTAQSSLPSRNTRSTTSVLPTKLPNKREAKLTKCKSAPSTTLNFTTGDEDKREQNRLRRAKWNRPQAQMEVAVEHQDGVPLFRLTTQDEESKVEDKGQDDEEESYLDESFEEFEEDDLHDSCVGRQELVIDEIENDVEVEDVKGIVNSSEKESTRVKASSTVEDDALPVDLSKTTKELFRIIQHLSRSKQRALVDVLQQFQASEQDENDVKVLKSSIGDPAIWKEITATLNAAPASTVVPTTTSSNEQSSRTNASEASDNQDHPVVAPLKNLLEEQLQWEDEYTSKVKQRLALEREEKQRILKEAEERRAKMMKQLEDEEREIEQLMEIKRQERLARLRALQEETAPTDVPINYPRQEPVEIEKHANSTVDGQTKVFRNVKTEEKRRKDKGESMYSADAKTTSLAATTPSEISERTTNEEISATKYAQEPAPIVPRLNLTFNSTKETTISSERHEIQLKLLSTWGKTKAVGLTQISVYDLNGEELSVDLDTLQLYDQPTGRPLPKTNDMVRGLQRLFNDIAQTNRENDMWLGRLGDSGVLVIKFEVSSTPSKLCVWNYNSKTQTACTRDIEVLTSGKSVWTGSLPETFGDVDDNPCTWIDLLGKTRKSSRTARLDEQSLLSNRSNVKSSRQWTETFKSEQPATTQIHEQSSEKSTGRTPLWLSGTLSSSLSTDRLLTTSRSSVDLDTLIADEKPTSGSITSRRRQGKPRSTTNDVKYAHTLPDQPDVKLHSSDTFEVKKEEKPRYEEQVLASTLASLSSWDSLEKFSKTNRSRLPIPTDVFESTASQGENINERFEDKTKSPTSFTTSALLTELRHGAVVPTFSSAPQSLYPKGPSFADTTSPVESEIVRDTIAQIPTLPSGKWLQVEILSTWGDPYYVGLNGVELFNHYGELVKWEDPVRQVTAFPESINVLEENTDDPRVPKNLVDGVNFTCDDFHMWLAPYTPGQAHYVLLEMNSTTSISMVRIWNYNKSRTHTCRGVREARLILYNSFPTELELKNKLGDGGSIIFEGEIRQAPGLVGADSMEISNEVILFTQETAILEAIEANDEAVRAIAREQKREDEEIREIVDSVHRSLERRRPRTSDAGTQIVESNNEDQLKRVDRDGRPMTMATRANGRGNILRTSMDSWIVEDPQIKAPDTGKISEGESRIVDDDDLNAGGNLPRGRRLTLHLHSSWGDKNYIGLTQIEVLVGTHGTPIPLDVTDMGATPRDLQSLGYIGDPRTLDKLIDGEATTCDDTHMWLVPFEAGTIPEVRIELKTVQYLFGLRVWNYNKSPEDTYRGVKQLSVMLDGVAISPKETGYLIRKAPGVADFNFGQLVRFSDVKSTKKAPTYSERVSYPFTSRSYKTPIIRQDYETPLYPQGFLLKIICWTAWGDPYYVGLNGLELYDFTGSRIIEKPAIITAVPYSVSELDNSSGQQQDTRTPDNLVSGMDKNTWEAHDAWLAPLASSLGNPQGNIVYIGFDMPVVLSMIKFWNYSKTPERGVKDIDIYLDDMHLFSGTLNKAPPVDIHGASGRFSKVHKVMEQFGQPVLFSCSQAQVDVEKRNVYYCGGEEQDVLGINEGQVMQESRAMYRKPDPGAEGVIVDLELRPMTAVCRQ